MIGAISPRAPSVVVPTIIVLGEAEERGGTALFMEASWWTCI